MSKSIFINQNYFFIFEKKKEAFATFQIILFCLFFSHAKKFILIVTSYIIIINNIIL